MLKLHYHASKVKEEKQNIIDYLQKYHDEIVLIYGHSPHSLNHAKLMAAAEIIGNLERKIIDAYEEALKEKNDEKAIRVLTAKIREEEDRKSLPLPEKERKKESR